jgi:hypothetical protein
MSNELVSKTSTNLQTVADAFREALADSPTPLIKFKKDKYVTAGDAELPLGTQFVAYCADWQRGWVKFVDGELVEKRIGRVADRFHPLERDELGDLDKTLWDKDDDGVPQSPWSFQHYLPLENIETGERVVFVSSSVGGGISVETLCAKWARRLDRGLSGLPIVKLAIGEFRTKRYGAVKRPEFEVVSWDNDAPPMKVVSPSTLDNQGAPETDPGDPGFDEELIRS